MEKNNFSRPLDENLATSIRKYVNMQIDRAALNGAEKMSWATNKVLVYLILLITGGLLILMLGMALGFFLGEVLGSTALGFLCVSGCIMVLAIIVFCFRKKLFANQMARMYSKMLLGESKMSNMNELHIRQQMMQSQIESKEQDLAAEYQMLKTMLNPLNYIGKFVNMVKDVFNGNSGKDKAEDTKDKQQENHSDNTPEAESDNYQINQF